MGMSLDDLSFFLSFFHFLNVFYSFPGQTQESSYLNSFNM